MNLHQIVFSPTGGTKRVCECLTSGMEAESILTDLCVRDEKLRLPVLTANDLAVITLPVFAGRLPALAVHRLRKIEGHGASCVLVAVYGNRAYDDALVELADEATSHGFRVLAAVAAIAEHSIARCYAAGRPDAADADVLAEFGRRILEKARSVKAPVPLALPGNRPYKPAGACPAPVADDRCNGCGMCVRLCPAGALSAADPKKTDKSLCIGCMRCVAVCPQKARSVGPALSVVEERLRPVCTERKENELFL